MDKQTVSLLLCALLASTFAHDTLNAHHVAHQGRLHHVHSKAHHSHMKARANSNDQTCEWICTGSNSSASVNANGGLQLLANDTSGILVVVNVTAGVALALDINHSVVLLDGTAGVAIVLDLQNQLGVHLSLNDTSLIWNKSTQSIQDWLKSISSLKVLLTVSGKPHFNLPAASDEVLHAIDSILVKLISGIESSLKQDPKVGLHLTVVLAGSLLQVLQGSLNGLTSLVGHTIVNLQGDLKWLVGVLNGIGSVVGQIEGSLQALKKAGVNLNLSLLLGARNAIDLLVNLLLQIGSKFNLSKIIGSTLNDVEKLLNLLAALGGGVSNGVNGLLKVIANLVSVLNGHLKLEILIDSILEFATSAAVDVDIDVSLSASLQGLLKVVDLQQSAHGNSTGGLSGLATIVNNILHGKLEVGGINISALINILVKGVAKGAKGAIQLVVTILLNLSSAIKTTVSLPTLIFTLIADLNSTTGLELLKKAGIDVNVDLSSTNGDILGYLLKGVNLSKLLSGGGSFYSVLSSLPVIGGILSSISNALNSASDKSVNLESILSSSDALSIIANIKSLLSGTLNLFGGLGGAYVSGILGGITSILGGSSNSSFGGLGGIFGGGGIGGSSSSGANGGITGILTGEGSSGANASAAGSSSTSGNHSGFGGWSIGG